jgi:integrase
MTQDREETPKVKLTDRYLKSLKPRRKRYEIRDSLQPGLSVRVTPNGVVSFALRGRFPGGRHFTRKALGPYPTLTLTEARENARKWLRLIAEGKDPKVEAKAEAERVRAEAERARAAELKRKKHSFAHVAERYIAEALPLQRQGRKVAAAIRNVLIPRWGSKPIADLDRADLTALLSAKRTTPATAHNLFVYTRCVFGWAIETQEFGLQHAPTDHIKPAKLIGERNVRERALTDSELAAFWRATDGLKYPERDAYRLLALTGVRLNECVRASWSEIDLDKRQWRIPAHRMKGRNSGKTRAREHLVPLTEPMIKILQGIPRFEAGDFLFSINGKRPIILGSKAKRALDTLMLAELRANNPAAKLSHWQNHDLRRSCRSTLSALKIPTTVAEAVLAHRQPGITETYDRHHYADEKLEALQKWNDYLLGLAGREPEPENVVKMRRSA